MLKIERHSSQAFMPTKAKNSHERRDTKRVKGSYFKRQRRTDERTKNQAGNNRGPGIKDTMPGCKGGRGEVGETN